MLSISYEIDKISYFKRLRRIPLGKEHRLPERRQQILEAVQNVGQLSVIELSDRFDVSEVTIRQDLQALSEQGFLLRTRGGAVSVNTMPEFSFDVRQQQYAAQKAQIGLAAANLVSYGDTIFLDASTTVHAIIPHLKDYSELTVITNGLKAAMSLLDAPQIHVILPGGSLRRESISLVDPLCDDFLKDINVQIGFFGARGVTVEEGLTDVNQNEVAMKRAMVERCRRIVGALDARKWGKVAAYTFAKLEQIDTLITDNDPADALVRRIHEQNVEVILV
jgi:DeoR/GlpR family transcriptional regulator of sugar metabolism